MQMMSFVCTGGVWDFRLPPLEPVGYEKRENYLVLFSSFQFVFQIICTCFDAIGTFLWLSEIQYKWSTCLVDTQCNWVGALALLFAVMLRFLHQGQENVHVFLLFLVDFRHVDAVLGICVKGSYKGGETWNAVKASVLTDSVSWCIGWKNCFCSFSDRYE